MTATAALAFVRQARIGHLATVDDRGRPSVVPFCFALLGEDEPVVVSALDEKPKSVADAELARVRHIRAHPEVAVIVDRYDEDWSRLAWVQIKGHARIVAPGEDGHTDAITALRAKYPQYRAMAIAQRPVILIERLRITSWAATGR
jgi:PPOX class probable F420-dependent enzyme